MSTGHNRSYLTTKFRRKVFSNLHGLGHPSHRATRPLINTRFVWHGMNIDIARWCRTCKGCQTAKVSRHNTPVFGKFTEPTERFDHVHVDIVGPLPYAEGFRYLLTCVDRFTRWPEAIPMVDIRAETVADAFFSGWIARYGTPATITTDRGAQFESKLWDSLCNQFGIIRNRTTSYHPQSNGMVERFHRQLKAAIMAHESPNPWTITLPAVLLGVRLAVKERLGRSVAEMIYGTTLRLPGEFTKQYNVDANTDLENYSDKLRVAMSRLRLCPPRDTQQHNIFQFKEIATCTHVFLRRIAIAPPLTAPYDGPYKVVVRSGRVMKILVKGKVETVSLDRVKPAHMECEPTTGTTTQRKTPSNSRKSTATRTSSRNPQGPPRPGSADTPTSNGTRVNTNQSTAVRSNQKSATVPKQIDVKVNLSNRDNAYVAPHSRAPAASRANGNGGGLRTYSRIPLHLRGKTPGAADAAIDSTKSKHANIANREKISTDQTMRKTRVGRTIQTPARFVQMVHAIVAPNDVYGGPNRIPHNHNVSRHNTSVFGKFTEPIERFDHVHVDIVGPLPYADGFRYLLTCVNRFTRWPEAIPMVDIRAETVADAFFSGWIARYGTPATITTDRGAQFESKLWDSLCNQFGIIRNRTTSYHPQSNGMVERFHRQLKAAIMAHESPNPWTITLPAVLLGVCSAVKERLGRSAAEMIYGTTLRLPGEFTKQYNVDANTDLENYSDKLRVAMSRLRLCPPRDTQQHNIFQFKEIATCTHVFLRRIAIAPPLTAPYDGPYKVVVRSGRVMKILVKGKVETVSLDRVKPAHMECEPTTGTTTQRKTPSNSRKSTATRTSSRNPQGPPRPGSADTPTSNGTRVNTNQSTAVRSNQKSATVPKQIDVKVNLSNRDNAYVAPHSRALAASRAKRNGCGLRTYSRIPLHLRGKTPGAADAAIDSTKSKHANIANREKISTDQTMRKTRVGRTIQTPARFVQMVHAIVAPNDVYGGPNRIPRNHNVVKL